MLSDTREPVNCVYLRGMQILQFPTLLPMDARGNKKLSYFFFESNTGMISFLLNTKGNIFK